MNRFNLQYNNLEQEAYPIMVGDIDMSGNLQAHYLDAPSQNTRQAQ